MTLFFNGKRMDIDKSERMEMKPFFQINRCRYCFDKLNLLADISVGDCYIKEEMSYYGKSSVVIRTQSGMEAFDFCKNIFEFHKTEYKNICESQQYEEKQKNLVGNMASQGTTPRQITDLLGSLSDLTSGSGDKGTPVILIQGYFDTFASK